MTNDFPTRRSSDLVEPASIRRSELRSSLKESVMMIPSVLVMWPAFHGSPESQDHEQATICVPSGRSAKQVLRMTVLLEVPTQFRRSEEHTSELQSLMRISYDVFCLKKKTKS